MAPRSPWQPAVYPPVLDGSGGKPGATGHAAPTGPPRHSTLLSSALRYDNDDEAMETVW